MEQKVPLFPARGSPLDTCPQAQRAGPGWLAREPGPQLALILSSSSPGWRDLGSYAFFNFMNKFSELEAPGLTSRGFC